MKYSKSFSLSSAWAVFSIPAVYIERIETIKEKKNAVNCMF